MMNTNITNARAELYKLASSCIKYNNVININTKEGNVIMMSEEKLTKVGINWVSRIYGKQSIITCEIRKSSK